MNVQILDKCGIFGSVRIFRLTEEFLMKCGILVHFFVKSRVFGKMRNFWWNTRFLENGKIAPIPITE